MYLSIDAFLAKTAIKISKEICKLDFKIHFTNNIFNDNMSEKVTAMNTIDTQEIEENAINFFNSGYNCAQSVLLSFTDFLKIDSDIAKNVASGFGAGMGRIQGTCGAITGAYMVLELYNVNNSSDSTEKNENTYQRIQKFNQKFTQINGTTECRLLINCDLNTKEGKDEFKRKNLKNTVCEKCIKDSINLIDELLVENKYTST